MADDVVARFDIIEIFGYVIPGAILLAGTLAPFQVAVPAEFSTLVGFTLLGILAFLAGMVVAVLLVGVHTLGRGVFYDLIDREDPLGPECSPKVMFIKDMWEAADRQGRGRTGGGDSDEGPSGEESTFFDDQVWALYRGRFSLPPEFNRYGELWSLVRAYLATTAYTQSRRMQAMYEFSLRTWTTATFLAYLYAILLFIWFVGAAREIVRDPLILVGLLIGAILIVAAFKRMVIVFARQLVFHTKMDFYLDQTVRDQPL